jgi:hypothetical protein
MRAHCSSLCQSPDISKNIVLCTYIFLGRGEGAGGEEGTLRMEEKDKE